LSAGVSPVAELSPPAVGVGSDWLEDSAAVERFERSWMTSQNVYSFGDWRLSRAPGRSLVVEAEGYNIESGDVALDGLSETRQ